MFLLNANVSCQSVVTLRIDRWRDLRDGVRRNGAKTQDAWQTRTGLFGGSVCELSLGGSAGPRARARGRAVGAIGGGDLRRADGPLVVRLQTEGAMEELLGLEFQCEVGLD